MPDAARVDGVFARAQRGLVRSVRQLLDERDLAGGADHRLVAHRVPLPARPVFAEGVERDEPSFIAVGGIAFDVGRIPFHAGELGLRRRAGAEAEMEREALERDGLRHAATSVIWPAFRKSVIRSGKGWMPFFCSSRATWPRWPAACVATCNSISPRVMLTGSPLEKAKSIVPSTSPGLSASA